ncbi:MAG: hypothetical protein GY778_09670, partial [bacterium]|nr:hypothetical protein [bacterium]
NGLNQRQLTDSHFFHGAPAWSPDGEWIAFVREDRYREYSIYRMRSDGSDIQHVTPEALNRAWAPAWSPPLDLGWQGAPIVVAGTLILGAALLLGRGRGTREPR